jgi:hypothetical protein
LENISWENVEKLAHLNNNYYKKGLSSVLFRLLQETYCILENYIYDTHAKRVKNIVEMLPLS